MNTRIFTIFSIFTILFFSLQSAYTQEVTTFTGTTGVIGSADGTLTTATFYRPHSLAFDVNGNLFVADRNNHTIRKISPEGVVTTFAGKAGVLGSADGVGSNARFNEPVGLIFDTQGDLFVADYLNHTIRKITPEGQVTTFAGRAGILGGEDGIGTAATFYRPLGLAFDAKGNLFVSEYFNHTIRKISPEGVVTTFAGTAEVSGSINGMGRSARFDRPFGLAFNKNGDLFVAEYGNHLIRKITAEGIVTTFAGTLGVQGSTNGKGTNAKFNTPVGLIFDTKGNLLVADYFNHAIRKITPEGIVTIFAGVSGVIGSKDGIVSTEATFYRPVAFAFDTNGDLFVADYLNHTIRKIIMDDDTVTNPTDIDIDSLSFTIPNIFTPNKDGYNDTFNILEVFFQKDLILCNESVFKVLVYNRWGELVYQGDCNTPDWSGEGFPSGVYFYEILLQKHVLKGSVSLLREIK